MPLSLLFFIFFKLTSLLFTFQSSSTEAETVPIKSHLMLNFFILSLFLSNLISLEPSLLLPPLCSFVSRQRPISISSAFVGADFDEGEDLIIFVSIFWVEKKRMKTKLSGHLILKGISEKRGWIFFSDKDFFRKETVVRGKEIRKTACACVCVWACVWVRVCASEGVHCSVRLTEEIGEDEKCPRLAREDENHSIWEALSGVFLCWNS